MTPWPNAASDSYLIKLIAALVFLSSAYFYNGGSWGQNARYNAIYTFVEAGPHQYTHRIDPFLPYPERNINTGDWSTFAGHYYSNKAPGTSFLGIPFYFVLYHAQALLNIDLTNPYIEIFNAYFINLWLTGLTTTLGTVVLFKLLRQLELTQLSAYLISLSYFFCTMNFPYSTQLWGHTTAASFAVIALYCFFCSRRFSHFLSGFALGLAVLCDFLGLVPALAVTAAGLLENRRKFLALVCGGAIPLLSLLLYQAACFGSPLALPTTYTNPQFLDPDRTLGLFGAVSLESLWQLSFGPMRGMFYTMPLLLLTPVCLVCWILRDPREHLAWICLFVCLGVFLLNASFNGWHGGATVCARYQIVALPFWILPLRELSKRRAFLSLALILGLVSAGNMLIISAVGPIAPDITLASNSEPVPHPSPLLGWAIPSFLAGELADFKFPVRLQLLHPQYPLFAQDTTWNLGSLFGLPGLYSLLPLLACYLFISLLLALHLVKHGKRE